MTEIQVIIADDHELMRRGIRQSLDASGITVTGEAADGKTALEIIGKLLPNVAVLDISMPLVDGFGVAREIKERRLPVEVVFLTAQTDEALFDEAMTLGVKGYVLKASTANDLPASIRAVAAGQHFASPALTSYLVRRAKRPQPLPGSISGLTSTEQRILRLLAEYKSTREIAKEMQVSPLTVSTHRRNMCEKLGLRGPNALVKFALQSER